MFFLSAALLFSSAASASVLDLDQSVLFAVEHSPALNSFARETTISEYTRKNVLSAFFPSLDLNTTHGIRRDKPQTTTNPWTSDFNLELTENLYDNGRNITQYRISRLRDDQAQERFRLERDRLCKDVSQEFLRFSQASKNLEVQQSQLNILRKQFNQIASGYREGWKPQRDYLRFKAQVGRTEIQVVSAQNAVEKAKERLRTVIGLPLDGAPVDFLPLSEGPLRGKVPKGEIAVSDHREYRIAGLQRQINDLEADLVRRKVWPELTLTSGAAYRTSNYLGRDTRSFRDNDRLEWYGLLNLKFNFLDWGTRSREAAIATERQLIQENETSTRLLALREELRNLSLDLSEKQRNYELSKDLLELENKSLANLTDEYRQGKVVYLDYIAGLESAAAARLTYYSTFYDLQQGIFAYLFHQGTLYEAFKKK